MSKETIWARLKAKGFTDTACAAIMGNMWQESAFIPNNVEDRCHRDTGWSDEQYTAMVDSGSYTREQFMRDPDPSTGKPRAYGYGLCQWTYYTRKAGFYDFAKSRKVSIADEQMQIDWMWQEMHQCEFLPVLNTLMSVASLYQMTKSFMVTFENPDDKSDRAVNTRFNFAQSIYNEFAGTVPDIPDDDPGPEPSPDPSPEPVAKFWPPARQICLGMEGGDVSVLKAILNALGIYEYAQAETVDYFGQSLKEAVIAYQKKAFPDQRPEWDGIAGPKTWAALLKM